jgi:ABC-type antimicrobial peptide transport system permease subunit
MDPSVRQKRSHEILTDLGLGEKTENRPNQLSGGQQQRVSIARALMNGGDVILADEPTGALDKHSGVEVMRILRELNAKGHTIILVTHDMNVAKNATRIIEISDGNIIADKPNVPEHDDEIDIVVDPEPKSNRKKSSKWRSALDRFAEAFRMALLAMNAQAVSPTVNSSVTARFKDTEASATVNGVSADFFYVRGMTFKSGQAFDKNSITGRAQDVVIDANTEKTFFADGTNPVGQVLLLGSVPSRIIGVIDAQQGFMGNSDSLNVYLPYSTVMSRMLGQSNVRSIIVRIKDEYPTAVAENAILSLLEQRHGAQDVFTQNSDSIRQTIEQTTQTMTLLVSAIAVISLVVGGIGVMNIMLVSVTERTQEIGVRMAVGARQSDILQQFLIEAVLVCILGGILGVLLSLGIGQLIGHIAKGSFQMAYSSTSIIAAFVCSTLIGVVFGFIPARNAAQLNPVDALSRE